MKIVVSSFVSVSSRCFFKSNTANNSSSVLSRPWRARFSCVYSISHEPRRGPALLKTYLNYTVTVLSPFTSDVNRDVLTLYFSADIDEACKYTARAWVYACVRYMLISIWMVWPWCNYKCIRSYIYMENIYQILSTELLRIARRSWWIRAFLNVHMHVFISTSDDWFSLNSIFVCKRIKELKLNTRKWKNTQKKE